MAGGVPPCFPGPLPADRARILIYDQGPYDKKAISHPGTPVAILSAVAAMPWEMGRMAAATILTEGMIAAPT